MKTTGQRASLGYHDHYVVDGGKARVILHALVTPADVMENEPMLDQLRRVQFRWRLRPARVVADTTYGTAENIAALEEMGLRAYVPLPDWDRSPYYGPSRFAYDAARDEYRCPQGQPLRRLTAKYTEETVVYRAAAATRNACALKAACTASDRGRTVHPPSTPLPSNACEATTRRRPTGKRCASARSGRSRSSRRPSSGMGSASSGCVAWSTWIWKGCWSRQART
ncbi:MAG TPA: transposase [Thermomicrobiales bacterium]|nr:transposase [Thermomicrobiales bacterium]